VEVCRRGNRTHQILVRIVFVLAQVFTQCGVNKDRLKKLMSFPMATELRNAFSLILSFLFLPFVWG